MRCKNCHTVMMETDPECPTCHASAARATAAPPAPMGGGSNNLLKLLPIFGGAVGGLLYAGLTSTQVQAPPARRPAASGAPAAAASAAPGGKGGVKWFFGLLLLLGAILLFVVAFVGFLDTWRISHREPKALTAAELGHIANLDRAPAWVAYTFTESKPTNLTVTRKRLGNAGDVQANCLLVRVENKWMLTTVAQGFAGDRLVGRLVPVDDLSSKSLLDQVRKSEAGSARLLPFEFNGVDGSASDQQLRYFTAGAVGLFGLLGAVIGLALIRSGKRATA